MLISTFYYLLLVTSLASSIAPPEKHAKETDKYYNTFQQDFSVEDLQDDGKETAMADVEGNYYEMLLCWEEAEVEFPSGVCPLFTPEICNNDTLLFSFMPCDCHSWFRCYRVNATDTLIPCMQKCDPYHLVFSLNGLSCVWADTCSWPPGECCYNPDQVSCQYNGQTFPVPGDCHRYYNCDVCDFCPFFEEGVTIASCDGDFVYDPQQGLCVSPEQAPDDLCHNDVTTMAPPITPDPALCESFGQAFPNLDDCHRFYMCIPDGTLTGNFKMGVYSCNGDKVFDPDQSKCISPDQANTVPCLQ